MHIHRSRNVVRPSQGTRSAQHTVSPGGTRSHGSGGQGQGTKQKAPRHQAGAPTERSARVCRSQPPITQQPPKRYTPPRTTCRTAGAATVPVTVSSPWVAARFATTKPLTQQAARVQQARAQAANTVVADFRYPTGVHSQTDAFSPVSTACPRLHVPTQPRVRAGSCAYCTRRTRFSTPMDTEPTNARRRQTLGPLLDASFLHFLLAHTAPRRPPFAIQPPACIPAYQPSSDP